MLAASVLGKGADDLVHSARYVATCGWTHRYAFADMELVSHGWINLSGMSS